MFSFLDKVSLSLSGNGGKDILKFTRKYKDELQVEVDKSCFNIGRVAALPYTKNFKYGGFTWRGIVEMKNGVNEGLSDYILSKEIDIKTYNQRTVFNTRALQRRDLLKPGKLEQNELINFMLTHDLPQGMRNNYLWFQVKCLIRDSKIDVNSDEFRKLHKKLEQKHGILPANIPDKRFTFDENIVNRYFFENLIKPIYPVYPKRTKRLNLMIDKLKWEDINILDMKKIKWEESNNIMEDIVAFKEVLTENNKEDNAEYYAYFLRRCIEKYGEKITRYYFDNVMLKLIMYE